MTEQETPRVQRLMGPTWHICYTQDHVATPDRRKVSLVDEEDLRTLEQERDTLRDAALGVAKLNAELAAQAERLKAAMKFCQKHAVFPIGMMEDNPTPWDYVEHILSLTPSDALKEYMKPWIQIEHVACDPGPYTTQARQLLNSIGK